jgi:hypothetical protein
MSSNSASSRRFTRNVWSSSSQAEPVLDCSRAPPIPSRIVVAVKCHACGYGSRKKHSPCPQVFIYVGLVERGERKPTIDVAGEGRPRS